jgi:lipopolysaccharide biosynthesis glycosyltransferase
MAEAVVHIAVATDMTYVPWAAVAVLSCQQSTPESCVHVHVLHEGDLSEDTQRSFAAMVREHMGEISYHPVGPGQLDALPSKGPALGGRTSWIRILLPEILPQLDRIIYLDADTLTVDSVSPLWMMSLHDAGVAAVSNVVEPDKHSHVTQLGIADVKTYFNAGVLVMNLCFMREENILSRIMSCVASMGDELAWFDQDALNLVFADSWRPLEPRWNAQNSLWYWGPWANEVFGEDLVREAVSNPAILHFEGPSVVKPWHYLCQHPFHDRYLQALATTPWRDVPPQERTPVTRVIRRLPKAWQLPAYVRLQMLRARGARGSIC